ncbi:MAG TPA: GNAT family protein [Bacillota bacterium]|jgi:RimJ/RimL family protein N-acetyltransferase
MLRGEKTIVRAILRADLPAVLAGFNEEEVMHRFGPHFPYGEAYWESFLENIARSERDKAFVVCDKVHRKVIGLIQLHSIHARNRTADVFINMFAPEFTGDEYEADALRVILRYLFEQLNFHRISTWLHEDNERAIRIGESVGFVREALLLEENFRDGHFTNAYIMRCLISEFRAKEASRAS